jgi:uncharacterized protein (TIGR02996 family)
MTDEADFLAAIIERPDDDLPRLAMADWLDERGDPRGEFIRVQCELTGLPAGPLYIDPESVEDAKLLARADALRRRERELLGRFGNWVPDIPNRAWRLDSDPLCRYDAAFFGCTFSRGFVSAVTLSWADWSRHAAALLAACPLRRVNRPRACGVCGGAGGEDHPGISFLCPACRGTGKADDWRGGGLVRLTTWPHIESVHVTGNMYRDRLSPTEPNFGPLNGPEFAGSRERVLELLAAEYPGVAFSLPEPRSVDGLTAREVAERMNAAMAANLADLAAEEAYPGGSAPRVSVRPGPPTARSPSSAFFRLTPEARP